MNLELPEIIKTYFEASNDYDNKLLGSCFAEDAILYDEGLTYYGATAIEAHIGEVNSDFFVKTDVTNVVEKNGETIVTATVSGSFDGSPAALDYYFTRKENKIFTLKIVLAGK